MLAKKNSVVFYDISDFKEAALEQICFSCGTLMISALNFWIYTYSIVCYLAG
jgi:hypothetical protein